MDDFKTKLNLNEFKLKKKYLRERKWKRCGFTWTNQIFKSKKYNKITIPTKLFLIISLNDLILPED